MQMKTLASSWKHPTKVKLLRLQRPRQWPEDTSVKQNRREKRVTAWPNYLNYKWIKWANALLWKKASCCVLFATFSNTQYPRLTTQSGDSNRTALRSQGSENPEWRARGSCLHCGLSHHFMTLIWIVCKLTTTNSLACSVMLHFPWIPDQAMRPDLVRRRNWRTGSNLVALDTASGINSNGKQDCHQSWHSK